MKFNIKVYVVGKESLLSWGWKYSEGIYDSYYKKKRDEYLAITKKCEIL